MPARVVSVGIVNLPLREVELFAMEAHQPFPLVKQPNLIYCEREKDSGRVDPFLGRGTIETTDLANESIAANESALSFCEPLSLR